MSCVIEISKSNFSQNWIFCIKNKNIYIVQVTLLIRMMFEDLIIICEYETMILKLILILGR